MIVVLDKASGNLIARAGVGDIDLAEVDFGGFDKPYDTFSMLDGYTGAVSLFRRPARRPADPSLRPVLRRPRARLRGMR